MKTFFKRFLQEQSGSETVEWAVLGAMIAGIALSGFNGPIAHKVSGLLNSLGTHLAVVGEPWNGLDPVGTSAANNEAGISHGALVASVAKSDSTGAAVSTLAKNHSARPKHAGR